MKYRPEIDGLRALAVLPVIFFHAKYDFANGGYLGVDIFFVISGYLISSLIIQELQDNTFKITNFWIRRAKRILPALLSVILVTAAIAIFIIPPGELLLFTNSIVSSLFFFSNFFFEYNTGYFSTSAEYQPLLHTWSLSIEEQFYILFPIFLVLTFKKNYKLLLIIGFILTLTFSQWSGNLKTEFPFIESQFLFYNQSFYSSFMLPFSRIWELILGAFAAIILNKKSENKSNSLLCELISIASLLIIIFSIFYFNDRTPYPSFYTLFPCLSTFLLIIYVNKSTYIFKALTTPVLVNIGLISYSLYLIHYSLFSLLKFNFYNFSENIFSDILIFLIVFILSILNFKYIETPFRKKIQFKTTFKLIIFLYLILIIYASLSFVTNGFENRTKFQLSNSLENSLQRPMPGKKCFDIENVHENENFCLIGNGNNLDFVVLGDSHMLSYYNLLEKYANENNLKGYFVGYSGCVPLLGIHALRSDQNIKNCNKLNTKILKIIKEKNIKNLILISRWTYYTDGGYYGNNFSYLGLTPSQPSNKKLSRLAFDQGVKLTFETYSEINVNVLVFKQPPEQLDNPKFIYYRLYPLNKNSNKNLMDSSVSIEKHKKLNEFFNKVLNKNKKKYENLFLLDFTENLCDQKCLIGTLVHSYYLDPNHLSPKGVDFLSPNINNFLKQNLKMAE